MKSQVKTNEKRRRREIFSAPVVCLWLIFSVFFSGACDQLEKPKAEPFYAQTAPPPKQEFRWSNGKMAKSFDPALAAAPPETDIARAVFEGLTDIDPKTLRPVPAVAVEWKSSNDDKTWTFKLRRDARWSNGEPVTTKDFVRSWKRLAEMGEEVSHYELLNNIVGMQAVEKLVFSSGEGASFDNVDEQAEGAEETIPENSTILNQSAETETVVSDAAKKNEATVGEKSGEQKNESKKKDEFEFGVKSLDDFTLQVSLIKPDKDFPSLAAHPIFSPVYGGGKSFETGKLNADIITNGAFRILSVAREGITLERSENYWNRSQIKLERVRFVPAESAEKALEAYRAGEIDAVTSVEFEPLVLKLLTPFDDFRRTRHGALNFYEFNLEKPPFDDRRVREALAIAIERERLTEGEMEGSTEPALKFLPFGETGEKITQDAGRAADLLADAGFPGGENFPPVRLLVNRNNTQLKIARSVAKMWKQNLNISTEIIVKDQADLETVKQSGDFDLARRGAVLPTSDETVSILTIFSPKSNAKSADEAVSEAPNKSTTEKTEKLDGDAPVSETNSNESPKTDESNSAIPVSEKANDLAETVLTERDAIFEMQAIPLYFPTSYSLVKPYVRGFEMNILNAPSLKNVEINNGWQPKSAKNES